MRVTSRARRAGSLPARSAATTAAARASSPENGALPGKNQYAMPGAANRVSPGIGAW